MHKNVYVRKKKKKKKTTYNTPIPILALELTQLATCSYNWHKTYTSCYAKFGKKHHF